MIVGTAGHIDHGKTTLVKALTGVDTDRLEEEKARGISIDLGYAYTPLANGERLGFIDVPGHERFIHNMLAGATGIDFGLLVIAADDGVMPQTREHLAILDLLGIRAGAVALTKIDRVTAEQAATVAPAVRAWLADSAARHWPVLPVSARTGDGLAELRDSLNRAAFSGADSVPRGHFRLAVDRCFSVAGAGTVVTGTVFSGSVTVGDRLVIAPSGQPVRIRGLHAQNQPAQYGHAGQRCALNLADAATGDLRRGDWILASPLLRPSSRLDIHLRLLAGESRPLLHWTPVHVHLGAFHCTGRVALLDDQPLRPGESTDAQLVLDRPTCAVNGDRVVLRDASAQRTLGGGPVLDALPPARGRRRAERREHLAAWSQPEGHQQLAALLAACPEGLPIAHFAANANLTTEETLAACRQLGIEALAGSEPWLITSGQIEALRERTEARLADEHTRVPDSLGLNREQLRLRVAPRLPREVYAILLETWRTNGTLARDGSWWHLPGHVIRLTATDEALWSRLSPHLNSTSFQPPRVRDLARLENLAETDVRGLLQRAARAGRVQRVAHDHYFATDSVAALAAIIRELAAQSADGTLQAATFRDRIGTGRKLAIHILEFFDRIGLTRRIKDTHRLRDANALC